MAPCIDHDHAHSMKQKTLGLSLDRKSTRLNSSHRCISYAVFCLKKKKKQQATHEFGIRWRGQDRCPRLRVFCQQDLIHGVRAEMIRKGGSNGLQLRADATV